MEFNKTFIEKMKDLHVRDMGKQKPKNAEQFTILVNDLINETVTQSKKLVQSAPNQTLEKTKELVTHEINNKYTSKVISQYKVMHSTYSEVSDIRTQELEADLKVRRRYLRYRIYTTVGIALVILATYALAAWLKIPMPMIPRM